MRQSQQKMRQMKMFEQEATEVAENADLFSVLSVCSCSVVSWSSDVLVDTNTDGVLDQKLYVTQDANWNVTATVNGDSGAVVNRFVYAPYGQRTVLTATWTAGTTDFVLGHQGLMLDSAAGLYYNRARYYHPTLGRFVQRDPLGYVDGGSLYERTRGDPVSLVDYDGQAATSQPAQQDLSLVVYRYLGPPPGDCGQLRYLYGFRLSKKSATAGWIIQEVEFHRRVYDNNGTEVDRVDEHYWEAIPVPSNAVDAGAYMHIENGRWTVGGQRGDPRGGYDTFASPKFENTQGFAVWHARAFFWASPTLPSQFQVDQNSMSGNLPATHNDPRLTPSSASVAHSLVARWDCTCQSASHKTKVTEYP